MSTSAPTRILRHPISHQLPPPVHPRIEVDTSRLRLTSPFEEGDSPMGAVGFELTVFGLEHVSPDSARDHLLCILDELRNQYEFPPVNVRKGDASSTLDYAYITLSSSVASPRPDILEDLRIILNALPNIRAIWRVCNGLDCTRRIFFSFSTDSEARSMLTLLREWFGAHHFAIMAEQITHPPSGSQTRISFDLFQESDVEQVLRTPPFLQGRTLCPGRPRYIIPKYGGEVAIDGIAGIGNIEGLNHHIQQDFGQDAIAYSRIELEDDVYCVIFKDWTTTRDFLKKTQHELPAGWFMYGATVGKPTLLFSFNMQEGPPNPITRPVSIGSPVQVQFDAFRNEALQLTSTLNAALNRISLAEERQERNNQKLTEMIMTQLLIGDLNSDLLSRENEVQRLTDRYDRCQEQLCSLPRSSSDAHQQLTSSMQDINERRQVVSKEVESLRSEVRAIRHKLLSDSQLTLPSSTSTGTSPSLIRQCSSSSEGDQHAAPRPFKDNSLMRYGLKSPSPVLGTKNSDSTATEDEEFWRDEDDVTPRPSREPELRQESPLQFRSNQEQARRIDGMIRAKRRALEETVATIQLRTTHHDSYEEWKHDIGRDALHTAHHLHTSTNVTHAADLQSTHNSALLAQHSTYTSQLADVQRLLEGVHIKQRYEEERMHQRWSEEDRARKNRMERVIRAEEDKLRTRLDAEQRRREGEERRCREDKEGMEEAQRLKLEKAKRKAKEEEERQQREQQEMEKRKREKEDSDAEGRKAMGIASAGEDWKYARETLKNLKSGPMKSVNDDKALKSQWNVIRRQITSKIVRLTQDQETISRITRQLLELVCPSTPLPQPLYLAVLSSLSKSILFRAEAEVTDVKKSALPLAIVTCALLHHPSLSDAFPEVFFARMVQRTGGWSVPVVVPMHDVDEKPLSEVERKKAMGYCRTWRSDYGGDDDYEWESAGEYSTRITGIMRVYFLVLSMSASAPTPALAAETGPGAGQAQVGRAQKLFQLPRFWTYFARMLGDERLLETAVAAQVLHAALDVAGLEAGHIWGKQWIKLLELLYEAGTVGVDSSAASVASGLLGSAVVTSTPGTKASGNGEGAQKRMSILGGQTPEGKSSRMRVQLEIERILREL